MLLIEADERGYYPSSRSRNPSEGFISSFLQSRCKTRCRVSMPITHTQDHQVHAEKAFARA